MVGNLKKRQIGDASRFSNWADLENAIDRKKGIRQKDTTLVSKGPILLLHSSSFLYTVRGLRLEVKWEIRVENIDNRVINSVKVKHLI